ncbi:hypothetical protein HBB16_03475 [Pseudonocardia sp. MCCB 268]|nr:hypothetical protein [Pseudonocardia cytotoxica]
MLSLLGGRRARATCAVPPATKVVSPATRRPGPADGRPLRASTRRPGGLRRRHERKSMTAVLQPAGPGRCTARPVASRQADHGRRRRRAPGRQRSRPRPLVRRGADAGHRPAPPGRDQADQPPRWRRRSPGSPTR